MVADYNLDQEEKLRRMSQYNFLFHLLSIKKRNDALENDN